MAKTKNIKIDYWLRNCFRCSNCIKTRYIANGVDDGAVNYECSSKNGEPVVPWKIDGCRKYAYGTPQVNTVETQ